MIIINNKYKPVFLLLIWAFFTVHKGFSIHFPPDSIGVEIIDGQRFVLHKVEPKETLFSISRKYNIPSADIAKHNPGADLGLRVGQILKIPKAYTPPKENTTTSDNILLKTEDVDEDNTKLILSNSIENDSLPMKKTVDMGGYSKIMEKGYAILMPDTEVDERYMAFHKTLPQGTIVQVKNVENGKSVFVRVVGKFENDDPKKIISLCFRAEERLQATNPEFMVEIYYIP